MLTIKTDNNFLNEVSTRSTHTALTTSASDQTQSNFKINTSTYDDSAAIPVSSIWARRGQVIAFLAGSSSGAGSVDGPG